VKILKKKNTKPACCSLKPSRFPLNSKTGKLVK
jgi:hypothetical protein